MSVFSGPEIVNNGLVLHLDAANPRSYPGTGTTWSDLSGNGSNGTLIGGVGYSAANNGGMVFDGVNDRGTLTTPVTSSSPQTYEVWIKAVPSNTAADGFGYILQINASQTSILTSYVAMGYAGSIGDLPQNEIFAVFAGGYGLMGTGVIADANTVRQIVLTWNGTAQIAYVDGVQRVSRSLTTTPSGFSTITGFGDARTTTYRPIVGNIYNMKIYNQALSATEILQNYNALRGRYGV